MEQHQDEQRPDDQSPEAPRESAAVTRSQNVVLTLRHDWRVIPQFLAPALERLDAASQETQLVVLTADAETALAVVQAAAPDDEDGVPRVVPVTSARRAERLLRLRPAPAVAGTPAELAALVRSSALKLDRVRALVIAWADDLLAAGADDALDAVMAEVPKTASRTIVVERESEEVSAFVERHLRRARRVTAAGAGPLSADQAPVAVQYVSVSPIARPAALRRLLDELDPPSAAVVARTPESEREVRDTLRALGYAGESAPVRATSGEVSEHAALVVLYDLPATRAELEQAVGAAPVQTVAFVQPRQLGHLRAVAGGSVTALTLPEPAAKARGREEKLRAELRALLAAGAPARELLALEPLLDEYDGIEIAAAALRLAERERERARSALAGAHSGFTPKASAPGAPPAGAGPASGTQWKRVFMAIGEMDGVSPGDLVGAITGEAGITSDRIGKIELRENHTVVEIAAADADRVVERMSGANVRGRRVVARLDQDRPPREGGASTRRFDRGDRGDRGDRPDRGARGERSDRGDRGDRPDRPRRSFDRDGGDRGERAARGGRFDRPARGGGDRGDRPARGFSRDREERGRGGYDRGGSNRGGSDRGYNRGGPSRGSDRGSDRGGRFERDDRPGRRPGPSERAEWSERAERLRNARPPRGEGGGRADRGTDQDTDRDEG